MNATPGDILDAIALATLGTALYTLAIMIGA